MTFLNQDDFHHPETRMRATGVDPDVNKAFVDLNGKALFHAKTGGMMAPKKAELDQGTTLFRFGSGSNPQKVMAGCWWIEEDQFRKVNAFARIHKIALPAAMRHLTLVPPEWSDMTLLVRARLKRPLLALRGLGDTVVIGSQDGPEIMTLAHQNDIAARRLFQLYIPGLYKADLAQASLSYGNSYSFDKDEGLRGLLYLYQ